MRHIHSKLHFRIDRHWIPNGFIVFKILLQQLNTAKYHGKFHRSIIRKVLFASSKLIICVILLIYLHENQMFDFIF